MKGTWVNTGKTVLPGLSYQADVPDSWAYTFEDKNGLLHSHTLFVYLTPFPRDIDDRRVVVLEYSVYMGNRRLNIEPIDSLEYAQKFALSYLIGYLRGLTYSLQCEYQEMYG